MRLTKSQLKRLIEEALTNTLNEVVIQGPWEGDPGSLDLRPDEDHPPGYEYEVIQDRYSGSFAAMLARLERVAENAILQAVMEELAPYKEHKQVQSIVQDVKFDIEEAILDALRPLAQDIYNVLEPFKAAEREEEEERQYLERGPTPDDWPEF